MASRSRAIDYCDRLVEAIDSPAWALADTARPSYSAGTAQALTHDEHCAAGRWLWRFFPFTHGLYHRGPLQIFVSRRAGTYMSRVRLGTSNELNILRLRPTR